MKNIGIMGCGTVAYYGHLPAILEVPGFTLHAAYDPNPAQLKRAQERFGIPHGFTDAEAFFRSGLDAVTITSPAPAHLSNVLDAAKHGVHVLCEKPLAMDSAEARQMMDAMKRADLRLFTAFCYRFSPVALKIRELIAQRVIGDVRSLRLIYLWDCHGKYDRTRFEERVIQGRREGRMLEGGPLFDCGTHQIDLARWWLGSEVKAFTGHGAWCDDYEAPDHVWAHLAHASGAHTMVEMSYSYCHTAREPFRRFTYEIIGTDGLILFDEQMRVFEVRTPQGTQSLPYADVKNFTGMYAAFARALEAGEAGDLCTAEDGEIVTGIARAATDQAIAERARMGGGVAAKAGPAASPLTSRSGSSGRRTPE